MNSAADEDHDYNYDDELVPYVACCPITPEVAERLAGVARLPLDDPDEVESRLLALGFVDDDLEMDDALARTPEGHYVFTDEHLWVPFAYSYYVGGDLNPEDFWGTLPGWNSQAGAGQEALEAVIEAAVQAFTNVLGMPPAVDVRQDSKGRRYAAWQVDGNRLAVAQTLEPFSYMQDDHAVVYIGQAKTVPDPRSTSI
ncbi:hypothetical protein ABH926_000858 [Catenulispora sp. GP43]|uniref:hypothetical protein n=1 Tax=Catenulispora sp. GP43 TaxID=3156263 RepID=UPI0035197C82